MRSRLALGLAVVLAACSSGGSSSSPPVPSLPWGSFRHDNTNAAASGTVDRNTGTVTFLTSLSAGVTLSTPTIDQDNNIIVGTANGLTSVDPEGNLRWTFDQCELPGMAPVPVGSVSAAPTVTPGNTIVFGSDSTNGQPGTLFTIHQDGNDVTCTWYVRPADAGPTFSISSSAPTLIDTVSGDLSLLTAYAAGSDGRLVALNSDGSVRWSFPAGEPSGPITSTPAVNANNTIFLATPDGLLSAINYAGRLSWQVGIGVPPAAALQPSPAVGTSIYAIGSGGSLFAYNPNGTRKWVYTPQSPVSGSPVFLAQNFNQQSANVFDTIVYVVDVNGTAYGVRDLDGTVVQVQRCTNDPSQDCRTDSCLPNGGVCNSSNNRCSVSGKTCTQNSCLPDNGDCLVTPGIVDVAGMPAEPSASPIISTDLFVVLGTSDGRVCARALDNFTPGQNLTPSTAGWVAGCINVGNGSPIRSSPIIGKNSTIYVTTDSGLYVIK